MSDRVKRQATGEDAGSLEGRLRIWWAHTNKRSPLDPAFDEQSIADHLSAYYFNLGAARDMLYEQIKHVPPQARQPLRERLEVIETALGMNRSTQLQAELADLQARLRSQK